MLTRTALIALLCLLSAPAYAGDRECDERVLRGAYAVTARGVFDPAVFDPTQEVELPVVIGEAISATAINLTEFDGAGNLVTSWSIDVDGGVPSTDNIAEGEYEIYPDCTGVLHLRISPDPANSPGFFVAFDVPMIAQHRGDWLVFEFVVEGANIQGRGERL